MTRIKIIKPGTNKSQLVNPDKVDFYRQYGYVPESEPQLAPAPKSRKKTVKAEPAVEDTSSVEEVGTQDELKGD